MAKTQEPKRWDRRPWPPSGNSEQELYAAVGKAITYWERFETCLATLFASFTSPFNSLASRRAYVAVRTFEGRADMLRAASSAYFDALPDAELLKQFKEVLSDATKASPRRNDIAHGAVDAYFPFDVWQGVYTPTFNGAPTFCLYPSWASFKERSIKGAPTYCMDAADVEYFSSQFVEVYIPAMRLAHAIGLKWNEEIASRYILREPDQP